MNNKIKISYNSPVVLTFVFMCLMVTLLGVATNGIITEKYFMVYRDSLKEIGTYFRLFSHVFGHNGIEHFVNNSIYILLLGPMLEEKYSSKEILYIIIITAGVTGIIHSLLTNNIALCGASGVVFAFILLSSFTSFKEGYIPLSFIIVATLFIGKEIYSCFFIRDNVSNMTHIVGGTIGGIYGYMYNRQIKCE